MPLNLTQKNFLVFFRKKSKRIRKYENQINLNFTVRNIKTRP